MPYMTIAHPAMSNIAPFQQTAPVDVLGVARAFGLNVWEQALEKGISGKLIRDPQNGGQSGYSIVVNAIEPLTRKRFTVAHEIAHFILHRNQIGDQLTDDTFYRSGLTTAQEVEANKMAADILMPYELIDQLQRSGVAGVDALAKAFQVSRYAMMIRLGIPIP
jgi:IrrE N-terminal-like domain